MENTTKPTAATQAGECRVCGDGKCSDKSGMGSAVASESEILECLTRIVRRGETEDTIVKLREETKTTGADGQTLITRGERTEIAPLRPKLSEVLRACELLGKHYGLFGERIEGSIALPLIICGEDELQ